jgi:FkbM family methyltransferase
VNHDRLRAITRRLPLPRGVHRAAGLVRRLQRGAASPDAWLAIEAPPLGKLAINLANPGLWEPYYFTRAFVQRFVRSPLAALLQRSLRPGDVFVDIGANLGLYAMLAARSAPEAHVLAIEPEPTVFQVLVRNLGLNHLSAVRAFELALNDVSGPLELGVNAGNYGGHSILGRGRRYARRVRVRGEPFARWITSVNGLDPARVRIVKIDVEGAETAVVRGMIEFLERGHRPVIHCEVRGRDSKRAPGSAEAVAALLSPLGYRPGRADASGQWRPFPPSGVRRIADLTFTVDD